MPKDILSEFVSGIAKEIKEAYREAKAEHIRRTTPIAYWCHLFDEFNYSPQEFYALVKQHLDRRAVPDLVTELILLHEGTIFSKQRLYLELRRERFVFQLCAAAFGTSWFVSSRLFDKRHGAKRWHFLLLFLFLASVWVALLSQFGWLLTIAFLGLGITFVWSLMRLAAGENAAALDDFLCRLPFLGRIYETLFHPDTYFRQDQRNMYKQAVNRALQDAFSDLQSQMGIVELAGGLAQHFNHGLPHLLRVVISPAGLGVMNQGGETSLGHNLPIRLEDDGFDIGGANINAC